MANPPRTARMSMTYTPLKFLLVYLFGTLAIAVFGPITYYDFPVTETVSFIGFLCISIAIGYVVGARATPVRCQPARRAPYWFVLRLFRWSLIIALGALLFSVVTAVTKGQLNTSLSDIGSTYLDSYEDYERNSGNYSAVFIIYSLSLPFAFIASIWGLYYFSALPKHDRFGVVLLLAGSLLFYVLGSGKQKQLGDIIIYLISIFAIKFAVSGRTIGFRTIVKALPLACVALMIFVFILGQRYAALSIDEANINDRVIANMAFNFEHPVFAIFGDGLGLLIAMFLSYLSQGYYGLGLTMMVDGGWTYFLGFSYSLTVIASRGFGLPWVWPDTLVYRTGLATGWGESKWHTAFPYFASDLTFPGTVILFGILAYVYAKAWKSAVQFENPMAILLFSLMTLGAFFLPANNQLFHSPGALFTVLTVVFLYVTLARRFNVGDIEP